MAGRKGREVFLRAVHRSLPGAKDRAALKTPPSARRLALATPSISPSVPIEQKDSRGTVEDRVGLGGPAIAARTGRAEENVRPRVSPIPWQCISRDGHKTEWRTTTRPH